MALARKAHVYRREFGAAVDFRAGLHCGPLVTGEMGASKTEIVFLGDTVNTAARIQDFCRQTGDRILASADLIDRLRLPPGVVKRSLGDLRLRGKGVDLALYALSNVAEDRSEWLGCFRVSRAPISPARELRSTRGRRSGSAP
jgi:adenylate cyclase